MIQIYDIGNERYDRNGNAVLTPISGKLSMQAGGGYDISMTVPMDPEGKWRHIVPGAVVKAPVPREVIENSFSGYAADIYKTVAAADLREDKVAPTLINYYQWNPNDFTYQVGSKVSCYGWPHQNYECVYFDKGSPITQVPPYNSSWWKPIADYTPGAAVVVSLPAGSELYWIENAGSGWYKMSTYYGVTGYIQTSAVAFDRHVSETENQPRIITEQLFRLREPSVDTANQTITVTGMHVSYDLAGILCKNINITQASPAMAMGRVTENLMMEYRGTIATNLDADENGTYTGKTNGKNGMFMLLDPDAGIVHAFNAKFTRDNWDLFVMKKTSDVSGYRISYAKNMRGVTWKKSSAGLINRIVPVAKSADGADLYLPETWIDSPIISQYPVIQMELLRISAQVGRDDGTGTDTVWTESALFDYMREKAAERFSVEHVDEVVDDLTVQFEQLGDTAEYAWIRPLESVLLYDNIPCVDLDIGLEKILTVTELEWDIIRRKVSGIKLSNITGSTTRTVTGFNVQNNSITPAKLTEDVSQGIVDQVQAMIPEYSDPSAPRPATVTVVDSDPTLAWNTRSKVGSVQGTDLHVTMPANPAPAVIDNLTSTSATDALSANMGRELNSKITPFLTNSVTVDVHTLDNGRYFCTPSSSNIPTANEYYYVECYRTDASNCLLVAYRGSTDQVYIQRQTGGTWRGWQELALNSNFSSYIVTETFNKSYSVQANNNVSVEYTNISKTGYTPIGIIGFNTRIGAVVPFETGISQDGTKAYLSLRNVTSTARTENALIVVAYIKNL